MRFPLVSVLVLCAVTAPAAASAGIVSLTQDLDCTGLDHACVDLASGMTLEMNGHTITGGLYGIRCNGPCRINGPGTVTGAGMGITAYGKLHLRQVDAVANEYIGVECFVSCNVIGPASLSDNGESGENVGEGIRSTGSMKLENVTVANNTVYGVNVTRYPSDGAKLNATGSTFTGNGTGIWSDGGVKLKSSAVSGNVTAGIRLGEAGCNTTRVPVLKDTSVTGNGTDPGCGTTVACADLMTCKAPRLGPGASCDTSYAIDSGVPGNDWDVCSSD
jgi:hypothetical protein